MKIVVELLLEVGAEVSDDPDFDIDNWLSNTEVCFAELLPDMNLHPSVCKLCPFITNANWRMPKIEDTGLFDETS